MNLTSKESGFKAFRMIFEILSSKTILILMIGGWIAYYVLSAIWMLEAFASFAGSLGKRPLMQLLFSLFLLSGYLNLLRKATALYVKSRLQALLWILLPLGILIFLSGFFISLASRQHQWLLAGEGEIIRPFWNTDSLRTIRVDSGLKDSFLDAEVNTGTGLFKYEPKLFVIDNASKTYEIGAFPPARIADTYYHILNFGLAPGVRLTEGDEIKDQGYMPLRILFPGSTDTFEIKPYPYTFTISLAPEEVIQKGGAQASKFNIKDPRYRVKIFRGEKIISDAVSDGKIVFDNLALSFFEPVFWIQLEAVKDPGVIIILTGILLITAGIPLFLLRIIFFSGFFKKKV